MRDLQLLQWRESAETAIGSSPKRKSAAETKKIKKLETELRRKEKALAEAAALLIKKKAAAIWRDADDDTNGRSE